MPLCLAYTMSNSSREDKRLINGYGLKMAITSVLVTRSNLQVPCISKHGADME